MLAALIDAGADHATIDQQIRSLNMPDAGEVSLEFFQTRKGGFRSGQITVSHQPQHSHRHLSDIQTIIAGSQLNENAKALANRIFTALGQAEAEVHGIPLEKIHFHEVGAIDSIVDILGVAIAVDMLKIDRFISSPVPTGCGKITIDHGEVSVPAPATALLLKEFPIQHSDVSAELTTPTGAAFLKVLVDEFGSLPSMKIETIGIGCGTKDFPTHANVLRVMIGRGDESPSYFNNSPNPKLSQPRFPDAVYYTDTVVEMQCNLDDVSGEIISHCVQRLIDSGALDVWTTAIGMKKNRPATLLSVLARPESVRRLQEIIFMETRSLGIRTGPMSRLKLPRRYKVVNTQHGDLDVKMARLPDGNWVASPEFESCRTFSEANEIPLRSVYDSVDDSVCDSVCESVDDSSNTPAGQHPDDHHSNVSDATEVTDASDAADADDLLSNRPPKEDADHDS